MTAHDELIKRIRRTQADCPDSLAAADAIEQLQRDNAALMADGAEQARLAKEACARADGLAATILKKAQESADLRAQIEAYQALCAAAYQLAGVMNAPVRFLDALSDGANGELEARAKTDDLLPVTSDEVGTFLSDEGLEYRADAERYRWLRDFDLRCKDGVNINPPCEHVHASMYAHAVGTIPAVRLVTGEELDRAIDAAIAKDKP